MSSSLLKTRTCVVNSSVGCQRQQREHSTSWRQKRPLLLHSPRFLFVGDRLKRGPKWTPKVEARRERAAVQGVETVQFLYALVGVAQHESLAFTPGAPLERFPLAPLVPFHWHYLALLACAHGAYVDAGAASIAHLAAASEAPVPRLVEEGVRALLAAERRRRLLRRLRRGEKRRALPQDHRRRERREVLRRPASSVVSLQPTNTYHAA